MVSSKYWIAACLLPAILVANDLPVRLKYLSGHPVLQESHMTVDVSLKKGEQEKQLRAIQQAQAEVTLEPTVSQPPFELTLQLKQLRLEVGSGSRQETFDLLQPGSSRFLTELSAAVQQPIRVVIGQNWEIQSDSTAFQSLIQELQRLNGFSFGALFSEFFQHLFALANRDLEVGTTVTQQVKLGANKEVSLPVEYRVVGITDREVRATLGGQLEPVTLQLARGLPGPEAKPTLLKLSGQLEGKVVWSRADALIHKAKSTFVYRGTLVDETGEWPIELQLSQENSSHHPS